MSNTVLQIKRGLESNRTNITPASGEIIYSVDSHKFFIGDGITPGGNALTSSLSTSSSFSVSSSISVSSSFSNTATTASYFVSQSILNNNAYYYAVVF